MISGDIIANLQHFFSVAELDRGTNKISRVNKTV